VRISNLLAAVAFTAAFSVHADTPYLYFVHDGYAVVASPSIDITLEPSTDSQYLLSPHLLVEEDLLGEQIQIRYVEDGETKGRAILLSQRSAEPFVAFSVIDRQASENAETVTVQMTTNVPERVITASSVKINGQVVELDDKRRYTFTAYQPHTLIEGSLDMANTSLSVTGAVTLKHPITPDVGCELIDEEGRLYALCYANEPGEQNVQFYLDGKPIGVDGALTFTASDTDDLRLVFSVGIKRYRYKIANVNEQFVAIQHQKTF